MVLSSGARLGSYEVVAALGAGGMGEVYRARDTKLGRDVALKILPALFATDPERLARFAREAQLLAALNHTNIAAIYGFDEAGTIRYLVLELVPGDTLAERLRSGPIDVREAIDIATQLVEALEAAHERGVIHRDLKPANIKVTPAGQVKVLDFGLAKALTGDEAASDLAQSPTITAVATRAGVILGTAAYMSPEQARGKPVDKRTDIWAFGCVLYEMLTGRSAFDGGTVSDTIVAILERDPDWSALPPATPPGLRRLVQRCLEKDPRRRLRDIGDARIELDDASAGRAPEVAPAAHVSRALRFWRIAAGVLTVALVGTAVAAIWSSRRPTTSGTGLSTARTIATQLTNYGTTTIAGTISPDGRSFVFVSNHGGTPDIWLRQVSGGDPVRLTNDVAQEHELAYAPDGESIYFSRLETGGQSIWRIGALGGQARKILSDARAPAVSPDGKRLAYLHGVDSAALGISELDGSATRTLTRGLLSGGSTLPAPAWSPDGRWLSYAQSGLFAPSNLFLIEMSTGQTRQLTRFTRGGEGIRNHVWLPDSRHLVVSYDPFSRQQSKSDLGILDIRDGSVSRLTIAVADGFTRPSVSADGSRLIATAFQYHREVWKVPFGPLPDENGRAAVRVIDGAGDPMWTFVSRDGRTLLFNSIMGGSRNLWTQPLDRGGAPRQITEVAGEAISHSSLSPDGSRVAFASFATGNSDIWTQNVDGSDLRQLTNDPFPDAWPVWSPDGRSIVFNSLRAEGQQTWRMPAAGGTAEKVVDGFFRGDWVRQPGGTGTWIVSVLAGGGLRLLDGERRTVLWEQRRPDVGWAMPVFSPDGESISVLAQEGTGGSAIWVYDAATGRSRLAARLPFAPIFRAAWTDNARAFVVNQQETVSHIVLFDRFWVRERTP